MPHLHPKRLGRTHGPDGQQKHLKCIIEGLKAFHLSLPFFLVGLVNPLFHPGIVDMVGRVKALDATVELITNGTLLTQEMSRQLIGAGLDHALGFTGWSDTR